jgi:pyridoxine 5-phosphate synthase
MKKIGSAALSVNVNKVALVRNTRHVGYPSVTRAAELCLKAGAAGITVHPRPDERHIRKGDVFEIAELMRLWPDREYNIEGNPFHNLMDFIRAVKPHQATFVPDSQEQSTSDHGWSFPQDAQRLKPLIDECRALGVRVSLFMDPIPEQMTACKAVGADRVELYTETWASAFGTASEASVLAQFSAAANAARAVGLGLNAGHDLTRANLKPFVAAIPFLAEVSIGHAFVSDALELGYAEAVRAYLAALRPVA